MFKTSRRMLSIAAACLLAACAMPSYAQVPQPGVDSRFAIGDQVLLQPNLDMINHVTGTCPEISTTRCQVTAVHFTGYGKVLYDVAVALPGGGFHLAEPMCRIDSCLIYPVPTTT